MPKPCWLAIVLGLAGCSVVAGIRDHYRAPANSDGGPGTGGQGGTGGTGTGGQSADASPDNSTTIDAGGPCEAGATRTIGTCGGCGSAVETCYAGAWSAPVCNHPDCGPLQPCKTTLDCAKPLTCGNAAGQLKCCYSDGTKCSDIIAATGNNNCYPYCCAGHMIQVQNSYWQCGTGTNQYPQ